MTKRELSCLWILRDKEGCHLEVRLNLTFLSKLLVAEEVNYLICVMQDIQQIKLVRRVFLEHRPKFKHYVVQKDF